MGLHRTVFAGALLVGITVLPMAGCEEQPPEAEAPRVDAGNAAAPAAESVDLHGVVSADDLDRMPTGRLVELLGHELAWTRLAAATVIGQRDAQHVSIFLDRLGDDDWRIVRAAQDGLQVMLRDERKADDQDAGPVHEAVVAAIPQLEANLNHSHYYVRIGALQCLGALGAEAASSGDAICDRTEDEDYLGVVPAAFRTIRAVGPENFDPQRLFVVMANSVKSPNMNARSAAIGLIGKLDEQEQRQLIPAMLTALETPMNDGYTRFHVQARIARLLQKLEAEGTVERIIAILQTKGWGESHRIEQFMPLLIKYGPAAAEALPVVENFASQKRWADHELVNKAIAAIKGGDAAGGQDQ